MVLIGIDGEQEWGTSFPMWPRFESRPRCHIWVGRGLFKLTTALTVYKIAI